MFCVHKSNFAFLILLFLFVNEFYFYFLGLKLDTNDDDVHLAAAVGQSIPVSAAPLRVSPV